VALDVRVAEREGRDALIRPRQEACHGRGTVWAVVTEDYGHYERNETTAHRLDRNYSELLQEVRVAQMGVQILFAFLLGIAFQQRFADISDFERGVYLATLVCSAISAALFIAPVAIHRAMFRRHLKDELVALTGRFAVAGLAFLALAMLGAILLIVHFVIGGVAAAITTAATAIVFGYLWYLLPMRWRGRTVTPLSDDGDWGRVP
jgi:O-antigen/teichoic acid export membrane protein